MLSLSLGLQHSTLRIGFATLIERERETGEERKAVTNKSMIY